MFEHMGEKRNDKLKPVMAAIANELMYQDRKAGSYEKALAVEIVEAMF